MFGKVVSPGWDESRHSGGSLKPSFPLPKDPEPGRYYPLAPTPPPSKETPPTGGSVEPPYVEGLLTTRKQSLWPLLLVGIAAFVLLK